MAGKIPSNIDVAICGGGVAGSALAIVLARSGLTTLVVEREARFRDRVRGEGIHPWGVHIADQLGLLPLLSEAGANPLPYWNLYADRQLVWRYEWADDSVGGQPEMGVHHPLLQETLIRAAAEKGAIVARPAKITSLRPGLSPEIDVVAGEVSTTVKARLVVGADGKTSAIRSWANLGTFRDPEHHRFGAGLFDGVDLDTAAAHEVTFDGGRIFSLPQGGGRVRSYVVLDGDVYPDVQRDHSGRAMIELCAGLYPNGLWERAEVAGPIAFFSNADVWAGRVAGEGTVLVGDAAGANDPSCGNGMSLVFRDVAELSSRLCAESDWHRAVEEYASARAAYYAVLREHAKWFGMLSTERGMEAERRRQRVDRARAADPTAGGFAFVFAKGPDGLIADEAARHRFFGERV